MVHGIVSIGEVATHFPRGVLPRCGVEAPGDGNAAAAASRKGKIRKTEREEGGRERECHFRLDSLQPELPFRSGLRMEEPKKREEEP